MIYKIVLIRHGESTWNLENRFSSWTDVVPAMLRGENAIVAVANQGKAKK